jgi:hypothetical protein
MRKIQVLVAITGTLLFATFFGWAVIWTLDISCADLSPSECSFLRGAAGASVVGGILLAVMLISYGIKYSKSQERVQPQEKSAKPIPMRWHFLRSSIRITLVSLLLALPVIVRGTVGVALCGALTGFFLGLLICVIGKRVTESKDKNS